MEVDRDKEPSASLKETRVYSALLAYFWVARLPRNPSRLLSGSANIEHIHDVLMYNYLFFSIFSEFNRGKIHFVGH